MCGLSQDIDIAITVKVSTTAHGRSGFMPWTRNGGKYKAIYEMRQLRMLNRPKLQDITCKQRESLLEYNIDHED